MISTLAILALLASPSSARPPATFSGGIELVDIAVSVSSRGQNVQGLAPDQFVVLEDGVPQPILRFAHQELPLSVTLLLDESESMTPYADAVEQAACRFIAALAPQDTAQVIAFSDHARVLQDFTSDQKSLIAAVKARREGGHTALRNALYVLLREAQASAVDPTATRRAIVLFSDGEDTTSLVSDDQLLELARRGGVGLYSILFSTPEPRLLPEEREAAQYLLTSLTDATGGKLYPVTGVSDLPKVFTHVADELHQQYNLGFAASRATSKPWHSILVFVRNPQLVVRCRPGYYSNTR
jgi:VWFA-related protein